MLGELAEFVGRAVAAMDHGGHRVVGDGVVELVPPWTFASGALLLAHGATSRQTFRRSGCRSPSTSSKRAARRSGR